MATLCLALVLGHAITLTPARAERTTSEASGAVAAPLPVEPATAASVTSPALASLAATPPALNLPFQSDRLDYVLRCTNATPVTLAGSAAVGSRIRAVPLGPSAGAPSTLSSTFSYTFTAPGVTSVRLEATAPGASPVHYRVRCLPSGFPTLTATLTGTPQAAYYVVTHTNFDIILNNEGTPVWWFREPFGLPVDAKILAGTLVTKVPGGNYNFRAWDGTVTHAIGNGLDHHDLQFMPNGDLVGFQYYDSARGLKEEARFVRLGPARNEVWSWRTEDHLGASESQYQLFKLGVWGHANSVEPDGNNRLLVSMRNLDAIYMIDMTTGEVAWKLGGTRTPASLTVSDGTRDLTEEEVNYLLSAQHDARLYPDGTVSVFDNGTGPTEAGGGLVDRRPRLLRFSLDLPNRRATIVETITDTRAGWSFGLGSARRTTGGNWVISWGGSNTFIAEYTPAGTPVLTIDGISTYRVVPVEPGEIDDDAMRAGMDTMAGSPPSVAGTVVDQATGEPIAGAWVAVLRLADFSLVGGTIADSEGDYTMAVPAGQYLVHAIDPTGANAARTFGAPSVVTVGAGGSAIADPRLPATRGAIAGVITEQGTGSPVAGGWVAVLDGTTGAPVVAAPADEEGRYAVADLPARSYRVLAFDAAGQHASRFFPASAAPEGAQPVVVSAGGTATADVALPTQTGPMTGAPLTGRVAALGSGAPLRDVVVLGVRSSDFSFAGAAVTAADGTYSLDAGPGSYRLAFFDPSGTYAMEWYPDRPYHGIGDAAMVAAPAGTDASLSPTTATLRGTVTAEAGGGAVSGAWVLAVGPTGVAAGTLTASDGTYTISGLAPSTYRVAIVDPSGTRRLEFWDSAAEFATASPVSPRAGDVVTLDAALAPN